MLLLREDDPLAQEESDPKELRALMQECLPLFRPEVRVLVAEDELDGVEKVGLAGAISTNHNVVAGIKGLYDGLLPVGFESLDDHLLYVHHAQTMCSF